MEKAHVHQFEHQMGDEKAHKMCECGIVLTVSESRKLMKRVVEALNGLGFTGGFYTYKRGECSCCYGLDGQFFQVNYNVPGNWVRGRGHFSMKVSYETGDKQEAERFRDAVNRLLSFYFGDAVDQAADIYKAPIVNVL